MNGTSGKMNQVWLLISYHETGHCTYNTTSAFRSFQKSSKQSGSADNTLIYLSAILALRKHVSWLPRSAIGNTLPWHRKLSEKMCLASQVSGKSLDLKPPVVETSHCEPHYLMDTKTNKTPRPCHWLAHLPHYPVITPSSPGSRSSLRSSEVCFAFMNLRVLSVDQEDVITFQSPVCPR